MATWPSCAAAWPRPRSTTATGISPWFLAEFGRAVGLEHEVATLGPRLADPADPEAATLLATAKRAGFGDRELAALAGVDAGDLARTRDALGLRPGYAMVDTCAAEFAAETPYFYATYAAAGSPPEMPPVPDRRPWSSARDRSGSARASSSTTAPCTPRNRSAARAGRRS